jgi:formylglycine-generating enzyme required for sulfatase activity
MRPLWHHLAAGAIGVTLLVTAGCGGASSGIGSTTAGNALVQTVAQTRASYQIIDLNTGVITPVASVPDLATNANYRTNQLVMCLVQAGSGTIGTPSGAVGSSLDAPASAISYGRYYLSAFDTTQAQWQLIAGTTPWLQLASATSSADIRIGANYPAIGISYNVAQAACASFAAAHGMTLVLPSDAQWEIACRAGGTQTYWWGNSTSASVVAANALVWETAQNQRGAQPVGLLQPNAFGFYDIEGNVWQMTSAGHLRGGSWNDPLATARCANTASIDPDTAHLLVGLRLCYNP